MKKGSITAVFLAVGVISSLGYTAIAQQTPPGGLPRQPTASPAPRRTTPPRIRTNQPTRTNISATDRQFTIQAAQGGMAEVMLSELAVERAVSDDVKQYAQRLIEDHTKANNELKQLAARKGITLPRDTNAQHKAIMARLKQIPGTRFDLTYIRQMERDHAKTIALFQREERQGRDPEVQDFATKYLPAIEEHLQLARQIRKNLVGNNQNSLNR